MATWVHRAGRDHEHQKEFLDTNRICITWEVLQGQELSHIKKVQDVSSILTKLLPTASVAKIGNHAGQIFSFLAKMKPGDLVLTPLSDRTVAIGEITGPHRYDANEKFMYRHFRAVQWLNTECRRSELDEALQQSLRGRNTIYEVAAADADIRIRSFV